MCVCVCCCWWTAKGQKEPEFVDAFGSPFDALSSCPTRVHFSGFFSLPSLSLLALLVRYCHSDVTRLSPRRRRRRSQWSPAFCGMDFFPRNERTGGGFGG